MEPKSRVLRMRHRLIVLRESKGAKLLLSGDEAEMSEDEEVGKAVAKSL